MNEDRELVPQDNVKLKSTTKELKDFDPVFLENLDLFPQEIRSALLETSPLILKKLFSDKTVKQEKEMRGRGSEDDLEKMLEDIRHEKNEWTEDEVEKMDEVRREIVARNTLIDFLRSIKIQEIVVQNPKAVFEIMDSLWKNRNEKSDGINLYREDYFESVQKECDLLISEQKKIVNELNKLGNKKGLNRTSQKRIEQLKQELAEHYGKVWEDVGILYPAHISSGDKQKQLKSLDDELDKKKSEKVYQTTLSFLFQYMDASEFSIIFNEIISERLRSLERQDKNKMQEIFSIIQNWYNIHEFEQPIKKFSQADISAEKRQQKLIEHFWRLFNSYLRLKSDKKTSESRLDNTTRELSVVINLLNK